MIGAFDGAVNRQADQIANNLCERLAEVVAQESDMPGSNAVTQRATAMGVALAYLSGAADAILNDRDDQAVFLLALARVLSDVLHIVDDVLEEAATR